MLDRIINYFSGGNSVGFSERNKRRSSKNKLSVVGVNNSFVDNSAEIKHTIIEVNGNDNKIIFDNSCSLSGCHILVIGDHNTIHIGEGCKLFDTEFWIEDAGNLIDVGRNTYIAGKTQLSTIEGTRITIGEDSMFSSDIHFRIGDSHSIINLDGKRINKSKDIVIGKHCWIGTKVICLKGTEVADNCVVGAGSLLSGKYDIPNCVYGGSPAHILKKDINWTRELV